MSFKKISKKIWRLVKYILLLPIYELSCVVPKKNNLWIFGSWLGQKFADNSKYLFLYVQQEHPEIRAIWLAHDSKVVSEVREMGYESYRAHSIKGFLFSMRAGCIIVDQGLVDLNKYAIGRAKKIKLWHGTPLKKIGADDTLHYHKNEGRFKILQRSIKEKIFPFTTSHFQLVIAMSAEAKSKLASAFRMPESHFRITGYPRNDILKGSRHVTVETGSWLDKIQICSIGSTIVGYLPTWRDTQEVDLLFSYGFAESDFQDFLERYNAVFWIKNHSDSQLQLSIDKNKFSRIFTLSDKQLPDIYPLLRETNILITDYSSVYFDYLLLNRPIIFAPFDFEDYVRKDRKLYYDYDEVTPGPKARNWPEVIELLKAIMNGKDEWEVQRDRICRRFNKFNDSDSSKRVFEEIRKLLK